MVEREQQMQGVAQQSAQEMGLGAIAQQEWDAVVKLLMDGKANVDAADNDGVSRGAGSWLV